MSFITSFRNTSPIAELVKTKANGNINLVVQGN